MLKEQINHQPDKQMKKSNQQRFFILPATCCVLFFMSCSQQDQNGTAEQPAPVITPVTVTGPVTATLTDEVELSATSAYLKKSYVKANTNGYIVVTNAELGKQVEGGTLLFSLITKEAKAIGNAVNQLDPELMFSGISRIKADQSGFISQVSHQKGDYVQDGEALATISNQNSLVFLLNLPYEFQSAVRQQQQLEVVLPDGQKLDGHVSGILPVVDTAAQTQQVIIKVNTSLRIPEGLIARVKVIRSARLNVQTLPAAAVLSNETEDAFWVMKLISDTVAVKVPVKKGMEKENTIEILSPVFGAGDRILKSGNYGLADTAGVKIIR